MINKVYKEWFEKERDEPYAVGGVTGIEMFLKLIPKRKKKVLVIGCGEGHEVDWFVKHGHEAMGITVNEEEARNGRKKYGVKIKVADMHELGKLPQFDAIFASNVLEHSPMPYLALYHWRKYLKDGGYLVLVMPSKEWLPEYYHYSVMTRDQVKDLLHKTGYELLAGPKMKPKVSLNGGDIFHDLGRIWGFSDGFLAKKVEMPKNKLMLGEVNEGYEERGNPLSRIVKKSLKWPYNKVRVWWARNIREW